MSRPFVTPVQEFERASEPTQAALWSRRPGSGHGANSLGPALAQANFDDVGWRIGWDHARWGLTPPHDHLHPGNPVREGWISGRQGPQRAGAAALPEAQALLQLRLQCWRDGRSFDAHSVTLRLLARMRALRCPVTRQPFGQGPQAARAIVLNTRAACAAGNVAFVEARVADAARGLGLAQVLEQVIELARGAQAANRNGIAPEPGRGLQAVEWRRLASLICLATPMSHEQAAQSPLHLMPPLNARVLNPEHALQALLGSAAALPSREGACALDVLGRAVPARARRALFVLCSALLARRLHVPASQPQQAVEAIEDAWADSRVASSWSRFIALVSRAECEEAVARAAGHIVVSIPVIASKDSPEDAPEGAPNGTLERTPKGTPEGRRRWRVLSAGDATDGWALPAEQAQISQS